MATEPGLEPTVIRTSNEQDINTALAWLEGPWQAAENRRGAANAAAVIRALRDAHETPPASNSNDMAAEFQRWLNAKGGDKGLMAAFYAGYMIAIRGSHETGEHRANEWADMATNGIQWLRNIRDGVSTPAEALQEMESNLTRIQTLQHTPKAVPVETLPDTLVRWMSHDTWRCRCKSPGDINIKLCNYCGGCGTHRPEKKASEGPG